MTEAAKLDEREQFETWWQSRGKRKPARSSELGHTDEYDTANVEMAWKGWQARAGLRSSSDPDAVRALELIASFPIDEQNQLKRDSDLIYGFNDWKLTVGDVRRARAAQRQLPAGNADEDIKSETFATINPDGSMSLDAYAGMSREELKKRCRKLCSAVDDWQFAAMLAATDGGNRVENVRERYRSKISNLIEAYSDDDTSLPSSSPSSTKLRGDSNG